jgi:hypothetical protein
MNIFFTCKNTLVIVLQLYRWADSCRRVAIRVDTATVCVRVTLTLLQAPSSNHKGTSQRYVQATGREERTSGFKSLLKLTPQIILLHEKTVLLPCSLETNTVSRPTTYKSNPDIHIIILEDSFSHSLFTYTPFHVWVPEQVLKVNSSVFWVVTQCKVVWYRHFGTTFGSIFKGKACWTAWPLKVGRIGCPETSVSNKLMLRNNQKTEDFISTATEV